MVYVFSPKGQANEIIRRFLNLEPMMYSTQCALVLVEKILELSHPHTIVYSELVNGELIEYTQQFYWEQVKEELENILYGRNK